MSLFRNRSLVAYKETVASIKYASQFFVNRSMYHLKPFENQEFCRIFNYLILREILHEYVSLGMRKFNPDEIFEQTEASLEKEKNE